MNIRKARMSDLPTMMAIYDYARTQMVANGNPNQWPTGYPWPGIIERDIERGESYVCETADGEIVGVFTFALGEDPTYAYIEDGEWLDNSPYGTLHRIASNGKVKGLATRVIEWCIAQHSNLRADTHKDNHIMQAVLKNNGFKECGTIYVSNGTQRTAYQLTL